MISFVRADDRIVHGQIVERWTKEFPCDGIIAVNDKAAKTPILAQAYINSTDKRVFVWTVDQFMEKLNQVLKSPKAYFLITKTPVDMATLLVDKRVRPNDIQRVVIGPCSERENTIRLGKNQFLTKEEAVACQRMSKAGYTIDFALLEETAIGEWKDFKNLFGF